MIYIYDILLNLNNDFYEFYEWEKNDNIFHIKKIPIFLVDTNFMEDLLKFIFILNLSLLIILKVLSEKHKPFSKFEFSHKS